MTANPMTGECMTGEPPIANRIAGDPASGRRLEPPGRQRLGWLDGARGIGIVLVVAGHAIRTVEKTSDLESDATFKLLEHAIYSFHMPLFFLIAGIASSLAARRTMADALYVILWSLIVPYVVWSTITIVTKLMVPQLPDSGASIADLTGIFLTPYSIYWFLYTLAVIRLAWLLIERCEVKALYWAVGLGLAGVVASGSEFGVEPLDSTLLYFAACFALGLIAAPYAAQLCNREAAALLVVGGLVWTLMTPWLGAERSTAAALLVAMAGSAAVFGLAKLSEILPAAASRPLAYLGSAALAIYVSHVLFLALPRVVLPAAAADHGARDVLITTVAGLIGPAVMLYCFSQFSMALGFDVNRLMGLGPLKALRRPLTRPSIEGAGD